MGLFNGCLLASDADGTLINNGYIHPRNIESIRRFISEGGCFSIATGRSTQGILPIIHKIGDISPSVVLNGGMIYDVTLNSVVFQKTICNADKHFARDVAEQLPNVGIEVHSGGMTYVINRTCETDNHGEYEKIIPQFTQYSDIESKKWNKVIYLPSNDNDLAALENISAVPCNCTFLHTTANIKNRMRKYFEQLPQGVSKATALLELKSFLQIKNGGLFVIGDYYNDLDMISLADIGAATAEAPDDIKNKADYVSCSCDNGAVADFIDYLTLIKTKGCK